MVCVVLRTRYIYANATRIDYVARIVEWHEAQHGMESSVQCGTMHAPDHGWPEFYLPKEAPRTY